MVWRQQKRRCKSRSRMTSPWMIYMTPRIYASEFYRERSCIGDTCNTQTCMVKIPHDKLHGGCKVAVPVEMGMYPDERAGLLKGSS